MPSVNLSILAGAGWQFFTNDGIPLSGGLVYTYLAGTTTPASTYTSMSATTINSNPITLNSAGRTPADIWLASGVSYKFVLKTSDNVLIGTYDNITGINDFYLLSNTTNVAQGDALIGFKQYTINNTSLAGTVGSTVHSKLTEFLSIRDFGAKCDGTTDDTVAVQTAANAIGSNNATLMIPGVTKITGTVTFRPNTTVYFPNGGRIIGAVGTEVVNFQQQIIAGPYQIFNNCLPSASIGQTVYPEWWGARSKPSSTDYSTDCAPALNGAIYYLRNVGGVIQMSAGYYMINSMVTVNASKIAIKGAGNNITFVKTFNNTIYAMKVAGTVGAPVRDVVLRDFSIVSAASSSTTVGLQLYYTAFCYVENMQIQDFVIGMALVRATGTQATKVGATNTAPYPGTIGFDISGDGLDVGGNASSYFRDCYCGGVGVAYTSIGFKVYGVYMSDLQFQNCETAVTDYGFVLDYTSAPDFNIDIIIQNPILDRFSIYGIYVNSLPSNGALNVYGGYTNPGNIGAQTAGVYLENSFGRFVVTNHEFMCAGTNYPYHIGLLGDNSTSFIVSNNSFYECNKGVRGVSVGYCQILGNIFKNSVHAAADYVQIISGARVMVTGNAFDGLATQGVVIDATSDGCGIVCNTANVTGIATRYQNNGTNTIGGAAGATGLNSGV